MKKLTEEKIKQILEFVYQKVLKEIKNSKQDIKCIDTHCDLIIKKHKYKAGFYGFITGIGGLFWIPLTLPTNLTLILYLQVKMVANIAHIAGYDLEDERVKTMVFACLTGNNAYGLLKKMGIDINTHMTEHLKKHISTHVRKHISQKTIKQIQRKIFFKLLSKLGEKGLLSVTRVIPIISGIIGGSNDFLHTHQIAKIAKEVFLKKED
jgi:hypothetical protein